MSCTQEYELEVNVVGDGDSRMDDAWPWRMMMMES